MRLFDYLKNKENDIEQSNLDDFDGVNSKQANIEQCDHSRLKGTEKYIRIMLKLIGLLTILVSSSNLFLYEMNKLVIQLIILGCLITMIGGGLPDVAIWLILDLLLDR